MEHMTSANRQTKNITSPSLNPHASAFVPTSGENNPHGQQSSSQPSTSMPKHFAPPTKSTNHTQTSSTCVKISSFNFQSIRHKTHEITVSYNPQKSTFLLFPRHGLVHRSLTQQWQYPDSKLPSAKTGTKIVVVSVSLCKMNTLVSVAMT